MEKVAELRTKQCQLYQQWVNLEAQIHFTKKELVRELKALYPIVYVIRSIYKAKYGSYVYGVCHNDAIALFTTKERADTMLARSKHYSVSSHEELWSDASWLNLDPSYIEPLRDDCF